MQLLEKAARLVTPTEKDKEKLKAVASKVESKLRLVLSGETTPEIALGGSFARGTWLKGSFDIDFFIMYPPEFAREKLEGESISLLKKTLRGYRTNLRFAEHPYVEGFVDGVRVNLVPCYKVPSGEWKSAADRSPHHTKYVTSKMGERLRLEARLFKKFVKAAKVYGAEVRVQGFSGYVCEVLVLKYGGFEAALTGIAKLGPSEVISIEEYDKDLAASYKSPIVILDPVDTTRNLGAAISARNVARLVFQCRRFMEKPSLSFFKEKVEKGKPDKKLLRRTLVVTFNTKLRSPDILWGQLKKSASGISNKLETFGFHVLRSGVASNETSRSALLFLLQDETIGVLHARKGPEYFRADEVRNYRAKNRRKAILTWIGEEGRVESVFQRKFTVGSKVLHELLSKKLDSSGVSEEIRKEIARGFRITRGGAFKENDWLGSALRSLALEE